MMSTPTKRQLIVEAVLTRVSAITIANGCATDAGLHLYRGEVPELGEDDPAAAIAVVLADDVPQYQGEKLGLLLPVQIAAVAKVGLDQAWETLETTIGDIKRAIELEDRTLGSLLPQPLKRGPTRTMSREPGSQTIGLVVTYQAAYVEAWGQP